MHHDFLFLRRHLRNFEIRKGNLTSNFAPSANSITVGHTDLLLGSYLHIYLINPILMKKYLGVIRYHLSRQAFFRADALAPTRQSPVKVPTGGGKIIIFPNKSQFYRILKEFQKVRKPRKKFSKTELGQASGSYSRKERFDQFLYCHSKIKNIALKICAFGQKIKLLKCKLNFEIFDKNFEEPYFSLSYLFASSIQILR